MNKLVACKNLREKNSQSLQKTLEYCLMNPKIFSEKEIQEIWLKKLRDDKEIFEDGWYMPPPHGISVLFSPPDDVSRISYKSLRPKEFWPQNSILLDKTKDLMVVYASPVDEKTGVIGDFGLTLYLGKNQKIRDHFKKVYQVYFDIFDKIKLGMSFSEIYQIAKKIMDKKGLYSDLLSPTDPTGTNIGHTIVNLTQNQLKEVKNKTLSWNSAKDILSKKRVFVNTAEKMIIKPGMAFTIEPRPQDIQDQRIPMVFFHSIIMFDRNGKKEVITGFDNLFKNVGMQYMLS